MQKARDELRCHRMKTDRVRGITLAVPQLHAKIHTGDLLQPAKLQNHLAMQVNNLFEMVFLPSAFVNRKAANFRRDVSCRFRERGLGLNGGMRPVLIRDHCLGTLLFAIAYCILMIPFFGSRAHFFPYNTFVLQVSILFSICKVLFCTSFLQRQKMRK